MEVASISPSSMRKAANLNLVVHAGLETRYFHQEATFLNLQFCRLNLYDFLVMSL